MKFYPIDDIKSKINILDLFKRDGHKLKRSGNNYFCLCPFHEESHPSCSVSEEKQCYHCFGCETGGNIITYWQRSRDCDFKTALEELANIAGISPSPRSFRPVKKRPRKLKEPALTPPTPLNKKDLTHWAKACSLLEHSPEHIHRIANWRGLTPELVLWMAERQLLGIMPYMEELREAFIVKAPINAKGNLISTSIHIRLAPHSSGNLTPHSSWRFTPAGQRSWPYIFGTTHKAKIIFVTEGPWDAMALCQLMGWHKNNRTFQEICTIGLRGASSWKLLHHYVINPESILIAFPDADTAGESWFKPDGFLEQISRKVKAVYGYLPNKQGSDLNDRVKEGITRQDLLHANPDYHPRFTLSALLEKLKLPI